ncbi:hypothetical protein D3C71_2024230 [compost metagenome]
MGAKASAVRADMARMGGTFVQHLDMAGVQPNGQRVVHALCKIGHGQLVHAAGSSLLRCGAM